MKRIVLAVLFILCADVVVAQDNLYSDFQMFFHGAAILSPVDGPAIVGAVTVERQELMVDLPYVNWWNITIAPGFGNLESLRTLVGKNLSVFYCIPNKSGSIKIVLAETDLVIIPSVKSIRDLFARLADREISGRRSATLQIVGDTIELHIFPMAQ
jgi:hypothetical protein